MENYSKALKAGKKNYQQCLTKGEYPYLPALDDMIPVEKSETGKDIGIVQIPIKYIVGTKSAGRTKMFAKNYMPIAEEKTEFSIKWEKLCKAQLNEGIRDPIKVYEYMNRFYVAEGNKRVSVLKFFDAVAIPARVIRIMPERNGDKAVEIYYEFVEFNKYSKVNFIEFSKSGSYEELQKMIGKRPNESWSEDDNRKFRTTYYYFENAYYKCGGEKLRSTVGDAMLAFIKIYGYEALHNMTGRQIERAVTNVWEEIALQQEEKPFDIKLDPAEEKRKSILPKITRTRKVKIAFLHNKTAETSGWVYSHEAGINYVKKLFEGKVEIREYYDVQASEAYDVMKKAIDEGVTVIFSTSAEMLNGCLRIAIENPSVIVMSCALNRPHRYVRSYYIRMYEAKFIAGAVAGALCDNEKIGYICKYPIYGSIAEINAFARGVQLVNPRAKIQLRWSSDEATADIIREMNEQGIELISFRDFVQLDDSERFMSGLGRVTEDGLDNLVLPVWNWGVYYEKIIQSILNGTYQAEQEKTRKSLSYYWGMSSGAADMVFSGRLPKGIRYMGETLCKAVKTGICQPFYNPSQTADGRIAWETQDQTISLEEILTMDWLEDNIIGTIPKYSELSKQVQEVVDEIGIERYRKDLGE
ncbi:MAG: BMP family ABC transporter substrate-binding protein [Eubacteriales bacterium]|nr:BMP family ABC transporter substrate-binding protein [Eubacteriales bacterium]